MARRLAATAGLLLTALVVLSSHPWAPPAAARTDGLSVRAVDNVFDPESCVPTRGSPWRGSTTGGASTT